MKKIFSFAAVLLIFLSACGKNPDEGKVSLRVAWWGGDDRHKATLSAIELFESRHPDIEIIPEYGGWDGWSEKLGTQLDSGTSPDVMQIPYDFILSYEDSFYDLEKLPEIDFSGFESDVLSFGREDGKLCAAVVSLTGRGFFYNSEVYKRLGCEYPRTWDELISLGEKFSKSGIYPLDLDIQSGGTAWYLAVVYVQQKTGKQFLSMDGELGFDENDIKTALDFYKKLEDNHVIRTVKARIDEDGNAALYQSPEFIDGSVAGVLEWGSSVGKYEMILGDTLETGYMLTDSSGNSGGWFIKPSLLYAVSEKTKYPEESAAFVNFLLNDSECADILGTTRGIPASSYARDTLEKNGKLTGLSKENYDLFEELDTVTVSPYMELPKMKEFYNRAVENISYGKADTETAAMEMYDSIKEYLEKIRK